MEKPERFAENLKCQILKRNLSSWLIVFICHATTPPPPSTWQYIDKVQSENGLEEKKVCK
jgi:hypothetical protein